MKSAVSNGREITAKQAPETNETQLACPQCGTSVRIHRKGRNGQAAHFEHLSRSGKKCPCTTNTESSYNDQGVSFLPREVPRCFLLRASRTGSIYLPNFA